MCLVLPAVCCSADPLPATWSVTYGHNYNQLDQTVFPVAADNGFDRRQDLLSVSASGVTADVSWRLRLLAVQGNASGTNSKVSIKELNKIWRWSERCLVSGGKRILSWDVGYLAQPLGFFQTQLVLSDLDDIYGNSEGLPLLMLSCSLDHDAAIDVVRSDDLEHRHDSDNTNLHQSALRYSQHVGLATYSLVLRQVSGGGHGVGLTYSTTIGEAIELHLSDYTSLDGTRQLHAGVSGPAQFWASSPYVSRPNQGAATHLLAGLDWTPDGDSSVSAEISHNDAGLTRSEWNRWVNLVGFHQLDAAGLPAAVREHNLLWDLSTIKPGGSRRDYLYLQAQRTAADFAYAIGHEFCLDDGGGATFLSLSKRLTRRVKVGLNLGFYTGGGHDEFAYLPYRRTGAAYVAAAF